MAELHTKAEMAAVQSQHEDMECDKTEGMNKEVMADDTEPVVHREPTLSARIAKNSGYFEQNTGGALNSEKNPTPQCCGTVPHFAYPWPQSAVGRPTPNFPSFGTLTFGQ